MTRRKFRTYATLAGLLMAVGGMTVLVSYSVTLYRLFCQVTGAGGTPRRVAKDTATVSNTVMTVFFNTNVAPGLPWRFRPVLPKVRLRLGADTVVFFEAENLSDQPIVGHATFNVTPDKAGPYFKKIQCFCFEEERLDPRQRVEMAVDFFVDPKIAEDPNTQDVTEITLSYTFFRSAKPKRAADLSRFVTAPPDPVAGRKLFATQCSRCHTLDAARIGPPLAGVVGRRAGSVPGYSYSAALARSGIVWTPAALERWLAGPQADVPGALMPMAVPDTATRQAIVAYLRQRSAPLD